MGPGEVASLGPVCLSPFSSWPEDLLPLTLHLRAVGHGELFCNLGRVSVSLGLRFPGLLETVGQRAEERGPWSHLGELLLCVSTAWRVVPTPRFPHGQTFLQRLVFTRLCAQKGRC